MKALACFGCAMGAVGCVLQHNAIGAALWGLSAGIWFYNGATYGWNK